GSEPLVSPVGVAFDGQGRLWVADSAGRVVVFDALGAVAFVVRAAGGEPLQRPSGLAWSPVRQQMYVVDTAASRIAVFDATGAFVRAFGGRGEEEGRFNYPTH